MIIYAETKYFDEEQYQSDITLIRKPISVKNVCPLGCMSVCLYVCL